jgi:CRISPR-associated endonuclease/helicase Cas3
MSQAVNKASRLLQIEALLLSHPNGLSQAEIARRLGVNRSTVSRYIRDMSAQAPIYENEEGRLFIDRQAALVNLHLNLHEAMAVHLAARLLATRMDRQNPHAASALRKLGLALERLAPRISQHIQMSADVMDEAAQRHDPVYLQSLERLTLAWAEQRKVQVWHRSERLGKVIEYLFSPYFIEPYAVGQATHMIGLSEPPDKMRTLKIERIERVELTRQSYDIPPEFDPGDLLADAWGIWYTETEPVEVALRFHPRVANRVQETRWHRSEQVEEQPDGSVLWRAKVAEWKEMLPWVRGWGGDVEVLEPEELREVLIQETQKLASVYKITPSTRPSHALYYAHSKPGIAESEWQPLIEHLTRTADIAEKLGKDADISSLARTAALSHDIGKYSKAFQARLKGSQRHVDHATAGAREVTRIFNDPAHRDYAELLSYCIAGHHSGLPDYGDPTDLADEPSLYARREKKQLDDYSAYNSEIEESSLNFEPRQVKPLPGYPYFSISFLTRMIFSCLVDADWLETELYMEEKPKPRGDYHTIDILRDRFDKYVKRFENPQNSINRKRTETLTACIEKAHEKPGFYTLTVPTGGGKTLASMAFALHHAVEHGLKRVIYVIPFTSIIEQNAAIFKDIFDQNDVLEHHSNFDWHQPDHPADRDDETNQLSEKLKLASENWDIPVVVTTNVQFFESLFANKKSRARKLHNIARSVMIFDEAQMLPREYLLPCMLAVQELVQNYGSSAVFCTATQPNLKPYFLGIQMTELAPDPQELFDFYRRVSIHPVGTLCDSDLALRLNEHNQALCIVNTRRHARGLFNLLAEEGRYHLSTLMCPRHRKQTMKSIRERLKDGMACRVVSTQVLEAGVDIDFPVGYRALAGLDSIMQAAGRVNRERRSQSGDVYVFEPQTDFIKRTPSFIRQTAQAARSVLREFAQSPDSPEAIQSYFNLLDTLQDPHRSADVKNILSYLNKKGFEFAKAAENFRMIEDPTISVIVPYDDDAKRLLEKVRFSPYPAGFARQLQIYSVNIYQQEFEFLQMKGVIETYQDYYNVLADMKYYDPNTGIILPDDQGGQAIFFD